MLNLGTLEFHLVESHTNPGQPHLVVGAVINMEVLVQVVIGLVIATETRGAMMKQK